MSQNILVDGAIASVVLGQWQKVAAVVVKARDECEKNGIALDYEDIAARIKVMVGDGRLDSQGPIGVSVK